MFNMQGVNFCGYKINEYRLKIRDKGKQNNNSDNANDNIGFRYTLIQFLDYIFYGTYTMKVLVLKRFIPS